MKSVKEQHKGEHRYLIHDNGANPFLVYTGKTTVTVYSSPRGGESKDDYTRLVARFQGVRRKFIPKYPTIVKYKVKFNETGNSILLQLKDSYVFIGRIIYQFKTTDEIKKYYSFVGNSDVPYPVAVGKENAYFMLDKQYVSKKCFPAKIDWEEDAYSAFYDLTPDDKIIKKMAGLKIIQKRL